MTYAKKYFLVSFSIFIILSSFLIWIAYSGYNKNREDFLHFKTALAQKEVQIVRKGLEERADIFFDTVVNTKRMQKIIYQASHTKDQKKLSSLRLELQKLFWDKYQYFRLHGVRQFHFHLPGIISFLRFHRPQKYGDCLKGIRSSIEYVHKYKKKIFYYEEGRIYNGFRDVYPIFYKGEFVGSVEISYSFEALQNELGVDNKLSYLFLVSGKTAVQKLFKEEQKNYIRSEFKGYQYDRHAIKKNQSIPLETLHRLNKQVIQKVDLKDKKEPFSTLARDNKHIYSISFIPVKNLDNKVVAMVIRYEDAPLIKKMYEQFFQFIILVVILSLIISTLIYKFLINDQKKHEQVEFLSTHDPLTKIFNRRGFDENFDNKVAEAKRYNNALSIIFFDIDFFKNVNDRFGHKTGDKVLKQISVIVSNNIRKTDIFGRWGGEEFIILLPQTNLKDAVTLAEKLRKKIEMHNFEKVGKVTCSFGVTTLYKEDTAETFIKRADELLYGSKENGRNQISSS